MVEELYGGHIYTGWAGWPWLVRHAAFLRALFAVQASGMTPYEAAFDARFESDLVPFAETVSFHETVFAQGALVMGRRRRKAETIWGPGIYLGRTERSGEHC